VTEVANNTNEVLILSKYLIDYCRLNNKYKCDPFTQREVILCQIHCQLSSQRRGV
jgi:hypothetical protein